MPVTQVSLTAMRTQETFKALSDPIRRKILRLLKEQPMTAGALAETLPITKGTLSHHFNVLKAAELIRAEKRKQQIVYSLNTSVFEDVTTMLLDLFQVDPKNQPEENGADSNENPS